MLTPSRTRLENQIATGLKLELVSTLIPEKQSKNALLAASYKMPGLHTRSHIDLFKVSMRARVSDGPSAEWIARDFAAREARAKDAAARRQAREDADGAAEAARARPVIPAPMPPWPSSSRSAAVPDLRVLPPLPPSPPVEAADLDRAPGSARSGARGPREPQELRPFVPPPFLSVRANARARFSDEGRGPARWKVTLVAQGTLDAPASGEAKAAPVSARRSVLPRASTSHAAGEKARAVPGLPRTEASRNTC